MLSYKIIPVRDTHHGKEKKQDMDISFRQIGLLLLTLFFGVVFSTCGGGGGGDGSGDNPIRISGSVTLGGTAGLGGVTVTLSGSPSIITVTDSSGNYDFSNVTDGSHLITPSLDGYTFSPPSMNVSVAGANVNGIDFDATNIGYAVSGTITYDGSPQVGVTVTLSGDASDSVVTDTSGNYQFSGLSNGSYTITPSSSGYFFSPASAPVIVSGFNVTGNDFTSSSPPSVILIIGDGMGFEHVRAAGMFANGIEGTLSFEGFPGQAAMTTSNRTGGIPDSGSSGTAMATGTKVDNTVISMAPPGYTVPLKTILEDMIDLSWSTGLVTNSFVSDATPAVFAAHVQNRDNTSNIVNDYLNDSVPNVLFGGAKSITPSAAQAAGYTVIFDRFQMQALNTDAETLVSGQFGSTFFPYACDGLGTLPTLQEMTAIALDILDNDTDGFFLVVENELIDNAGHAKDITNTICEVLEIDDAVQVAINWAAGRNDTLIIVTADHETGGLTVTGNNGQGVLPDFSWDATGHTLRNVPVYAWGLGADQFQGIIDNTKVHEKVTQIYLTP